jgi:hypothetical protein
MTRVLLTLVLIVASASSLIAQAPQPTPSVQTDEEAQNGAPAPNGPAPERTLRPIVSADTRTPLKATTQAAALGGANGEIYVEGLPSGYESQGVLLSAFPATPNLGMRLGGATSASQFSVFSPSGLNLFSVRGDGLVNVGTTGSTGKLLVVDTRDVAISVFGNSQTTVETSTAQVDVGGVFYSYQAVPAGVANTGKVQGVIARAFLNGAGTLDDAYGIFVDTGLASGKPGVIKRATGMRINVARGDGSISAGYGIHIEDVEASSGWAMYQAGTDDRNYFAGNVGIGTATPTRALDVVGDANFAGTVTGNNIRARYQDVAEWVPATTDLLPGTVVVLNPERTNEVMASAAAYDTAVAGVVSAQPGLSLGEEGHGKEQIATTGRVKVRVDTRNGAIRVGDLLVTSDVAGTAMRSEPLTIGVRSFHQPGTIIGKALEPLAAGTGEILVLLSMQ